MALSKPDVRNTAQHYLVCGTDDCDRNCQFYCNPCHRLMCEQCRDEHLKSPETKYHEVVPFNQRKRKLPVEKCKIHPSKEVDILCKECNAHLCSKCCTLQDHKGHTFVDLETIYDNNCQTCQDRIHQIEQYFLPTSHNLQKETKDDTTDMKKIFDGIRECLKEEATSLKSLVDSMTSENIDRVNKMEESLMESLKGQNKTYADYISYLNELIKKFYGYLSTSKLQNNPLISSSIISEALRIQTIPETFRPVPPVFTAGHFNRNDVAKLFGSVNVPSITSEARKIKPMETRDAQSNPSDKQKKQEIKKKTSATKVREFKVQGVDSAIWHLSLDKSGKLWVSNMETSIVQTDLQGNQLQQIQTCGGFGYHTVTRNGELIYADIRRKVINKITQGKKVTEFIRTGNWKPCSIYSSHINGNILVGMKDKDFTKVIRYNTTGKEIQTIQYDNKGSELYEYPNYITENINGDICASDSHKHAVVVVTESGQYRFSYKGRESDFTPYGVCTDILGQILVCDTSKNMVHLIDQNGQFLNLLFKHQVVCPHSMCVDDENNVYVSQFDSNVLVFKYLQ
eukprot:XP_011454456.2 PREDICTED: uncharacterized protein LOC105347194 isoform X2 [Crassostrea gigas]